jgi:hypothetical protein
MRLENIVEEARLLLVIASNKNAQALVLLEKATDELRKLPKSRGGRVHG